MPNCMCVCFFSCYFFLLLLLLFYYPFTLCAHLDFSMKNAVTFLYVLKQFFCSPSHSSKFESVNSINIYHHPFVRLVLLFFFCVFGFVLLIFHQFYEKWSVNRTFPNQKKNKKHRETKQEWKNELNWSQTKSQTAAIVQTDSIPLVPLLQFSALKHALLISFILILSLSLSVLFQNSSLSTLYVLLFVSCILRMPKCVCVCLWFAFCYAFCVNIYI